MSLSIAPIESTKNRDGYHKKVKRKKERTIVPCEER
jgi:hypothetical protein